jgi:hypothetical protein
MADRPRRRLAVRWLALGVVTTVAALWLTIPAISVDLSNNPMILATAFTHSRDANAGFRETNAGTDVAIDFQLDGNQPPAERLVLLSFAASCSAPSNGTTLPLAVTASGVRPAFDTQNFPNAYRIVVPASVPADAEILCHLAVKPLRATYSERRIAFARDISLPSSEIGAGWQQTRADIYVFQQKNAEDLKVEHADPTGGSLHQDNAYQRGMGSDFNPVTMDWTDVPAERLHEFIYFIGAALIGLALSCYIEVARPWLSDGT